MQHSFKKIYFSLCIAALSCPLFSKNFTLIDGQMTVTIDREAQQALDPNTVTPRTGGTEGVEPQSDIGDSNDSDSDFGSLASTPQPDQREGTPLSPNAAITQSQTPRGITPQPTSALVDNFTPRDVTSTVREAQNNRPLSTTPQPTAIRTHSAPRDFTNTVRETTDQHEDN